ncbi:MAG TPA: ChaN family lipoprotein [Longimicrobiales bacterium]|nr:ChaN family lipoprotein [Longimicrobiales bacterium]
MKTLRRTISSLSLFLLAACASGAPPSESLTPVPPRVDEAAVPQEGVDYAVYRSDGSSASLVDVLSDLDTVEVLLFGEEHDDVVGHRIQLEVFRRLLAGVGGRGPMATPGAPGSAAPGGLDDDELRDVRLSLEMFERDVQIVLDEYLADLITEDHFLASARPWDNYDRDYRPMVELAKHVEVPVIAANAPRRYVNRASRLGRGALDALSDEARAWLPPLPYPEASDPYRAEWDGLMGDAAMHMSGDPLDGQTLWDASMGESIVRTLEADGPFPPLVFHLAGGFHVENGTGIPETIQHYRPGTSVRSVAVRAVSDPSSFDTEMAGAGDYVILTRDPEGEG